MNKEEAQKILNGIDEYILWPKGKDTTIILDGHFTVEQLKAILYRIENG